MMEAGQLQTIEQKLDRVMLLLEVQINGEKLHRVAGYSWGRTGEGDPFVILYPASDRLKHKVCRVYSEQFPELPSCIDTAAIPETAQEGNPDRDQAIRQRIYKQTPPFLIATRDGRDTEMGPEQRFSRVIEGPVGPATRPPQSSPKPVHTAAKPSQPQPQPAVRPVAPPDPPPDTTGQQANGDGGQQPGRVVIEHDWKAEALASTEALFFDTAFCKWNAYFAGDVGRVEKARIAICGDWDAQRVSRAFEALEKYASRMSDFKADGRDLVESHRLAMEVSKQIYRA
jgi:hypothetical protein